MAYAWNGAREREPEYDVTAQVYTQVFAGSEVRVFLSLSKSFYTGMNF